MTEINDIYFGLSRNYILYPITLKNRKGGGLIYEIPPKNDLILLYITNNFTKKQLCRYFNISMNVLNSWFRYYNIFKSKELINESRKETCLEKYGTENVTKIDIIKNKISATNLKKYGNKWITQTDLFKTKSKETCLEKYGVENYSLCDDSKKRKKETCLEKYGVENYTKTEEYKIKRKKTCLEKYGVEYPQQLDDVKYKQYLTSKRNNTMGKSKIEDELYNILKIKYTDVIRQYQSEKYPYRCDFYIPSIDTYIEYQGFWTHGGEPYIGTKEQKEKVKLWENKNTSQYRKAINDWTIKDVEKRNKAKNNNIKWLEFFNKETFLNWIKSS